MKNSTLKSPLVGTSSRNINKTPRNDNNVQNKMSIKSPITQKYDMQSMGSAGHGFKAGQVGQNYPRTRLNAFGPRGSHVENHTPNHVSNGVHYD